MQEAFDALIKSTALPAFELTAVQGHKRSLEDTCQNWALVRESIYHNEETMLFAIYIRIVAQT